MLINRLLAVALGGVMLFSCKNTPSNNNQTETATGGYRPDTVVANGHPAWSQQGNIYEVNVRQYTPEGTFKAFAQNLDRLKDMGVQTLWFMPIQPISKADRKGELGSYYAIANYTAVNPEFGTLQDFKDLVDAAHSKGFKVLIDWVANHTGADHYWLEKNKDFYVTDPATGKAKYAFDWSDTRDLNYDNVALQDSMINAMKYWLTETSLDGFRCDVAGEVPEKFWTRCIAELKATRPNIFMLAESNDAWLHRAGFDATYSWDEFSMMKKIAKGERNAAAFDSCLHRLDAGFATNAMRLYFTSNHDENTWNLADFGTMPGAVHAPFAVLTQTLPRSIPLIYSGQEEPFLDSLHFFYKDTITFNKYARAPFYKTLLGLRSTNAALAADASFTKINAGDPKQLYAFVREKAGKKVLVVLNLSAREASVNIADKTLSGKPLNVFLGSNEDPAAKPWNMEPWGYAVFAY